MKPLFSLSVLTLMSLFLCVGVVFFHFGFSIEALVFGFFAGIVSLAAFYDIDRLFNRIAL